MKQIRNRLMKNNLNVKLFSLLLAILLWSYVIGEENPLDTREFQNIPITFKNTEYLKNNNLMVVTPIEPTVDVYLTAGRNVFRSVRASDIKAEVDLSGYGETKVQATIQFRVPTDTRISNQTERSLELVIESVVEKEFPIKVDLSGTPPDNILVTTKSVVPETVTVSGARSVMDEVDEIRTVIMTDDIKDNMTKNTTIRAYNSQGNEMTNVVFPQDFVNVTLGVQMIKTVPIQFIKENELPANSRVITEKLSENNIQIMAKPELLAKITQIETLPFDLSKVTQDGVYPIEFSLPEGVELLNKNRLVEVEYLLDKENRKEIKIPVNDIDLRNKMDTVNAQIHSQQEGITVLVVGLESKISTITEEQIKAWINLENVGAGEHELAVEIDKIDGVTFETITPPKLNVKVISADEVFNETE